MLPMMSSSTWRSLTAEEASEAARWAWPRRYSALRLEGSEARMLEQASMHFWCLPCHAKGRASEARWSCRAVAC